MMKSFMFAHKGCIGVVMPAEAKFLNNPMAAGQMGSVISMDEIEITAEAKEILRNAPREGGSFSAIMLTSHNDGKGSIGVMGFGQALFAPDDINIGRDCDTAILDLVPDSTLPAPPDFIAFVDDCFKEDPEMAVEELLETQETQDDDETEESKAGEDEAHRDHQEVAGD
jgi:hypothetical protein